MPNKQKKQFNRQQTYMSKSNLDLEVSILLQKGFEFHRRGAIQEAKLFYEKILQKQKNHFDALQFIAAIYGQQKKPDIAIKYFDRALQIDQSVASVHLNKGHALRALNFLEKALKSYDQAVTLNPNFYDAFNSRGKVLVNLKRFEDALKDFDKAISLKNDFAEAYVNRGNVLRELRRHQEALSNYDLAISLKPNLVETYAYRGLLFSNLKRFEDALKDFDKAISLKNDFAEAYVNRGNVLRELRRHQEALANYDLAISLNPNFAEAHSNRGNTLRDLKLLKEAVSSYDKAITLQKDFVQAHVNRGNVFLEQKQYDQALRSFEQALKIEPHYISLLGIAQHTRMYLCNWEHFEENINTIRNTLKDNRLTCTPFSIIGLLDDPEIQKKCAILYSQIRYPSISIEEKIDRRRNEKPKIGYFSADFHNHATMHLMMDIFRYQDHSKFDYYAFSFGPDTNDLWRSEVKNKFTKFYDIKNMSDQQIIQLVRNLNIDIAIDLKGFTRNSRTNIFAERVAPIQINYLGYPGTMGSSYIDYIIADRVLIPEDMREFYTEKVIYLPDCYQPNTLNRAISHKEFLKKDFNLPEDKIIYCSFNDEYKITPYIFSCWLDILKAVNNSVLWILIQNETSKENLKEFTIKSGVDSKRLIFADKLPVEEHLKRLSLADIFLDTYPCNAHTTASDAIRMGVPIITMAGKSFASRVAASILTTVHLENLIANDEKSYKDLATKLGNNRNELNTIKDQLKTCINTSSLFDSTQYTRDLENIYDKIFQKLFRTT